MMLGMFMEIKEFRASSSVLPHCLFAGSPYITLSYFVGHVYIMKAKFTVWYALFVLAMI
jgi:hypothetical protein